MIFISKTHSQRNCSNAKKNDSNRLLKYSLPLPFRSWWKSRFSEFHLLNKINWISIHSASWLSSARIIIHFSFRMFPTHIHLRFLALNLPGKSQRLVQVSIAPALISQFHSSPICCFSFAQGLKETTKNPIDITSNILLRLRSVNAIEDLKKLSSLQRSMCQSGRG